MDHDEDFESAKLSTTKTPHNVYRQLGRHWDASAEAARRQLRSDLHLTRYAFRKAIAPIGIRFDRDEP